MGNRDRRRAVLHSTVAICALATKAKVPLGFTNFPDSFTPPCPSDPLGRGGFRQTGQTDQSGRVWVGEMHHSPVLERKHQGHGPRKQRFRGGWRRSGGWERSSKQHGDI